MNDDFHRPTLTFPTRAYNATQVRLYGLAPKAPEAGIIYPGRQTVLVNQVGDLDVRICVTTGDPAKDTEIGNQIRDRLEKAGYLGRDPKKDLKGDLTLEESQKIFGDLVRGDVSLLTADLPVAYASTISIQMKQLGNVSISATITRQQAVSSKKIITCGIIVGYSYEGHTYDLPKPKIMIIPTLPEPNIPDDDSGYDAKESEGYAVWLVDKLDECVEFELNQGFVEQLILDANLPGKRAPNMYAGRMMMGHRSGRLTE
jgi:hypothetical protein